jgi:DNA-binding NarL/FixJ family response regulator
MLTKTKHRILVINDAFWFCNELRLGIGTEFDFRFCEDGVEGLAAIRLNPPELILLNMKMPRADGVWVLEQLKRFRITIPVVIVSFFPVDYLLQATMGYNIAGFVHEDMTPEYVRMVIRKVLG